MQISRTGIFTCKIYKKVFLAEILKRMLAAITLYHNITSEPMRQETPVASFYFYIRGRRETVIHLRRAHR